MSVIPAVPLCVKDGLRCIVDLGCWSLVRSKFGRKYWAAYRDQCPISQPEEDHDDRIALYSMYEIFPSTFRL